MELVFKAHIINQIFQSGTKLTFKLQIFIVNEVVKVLIDSLLMAKAFHTMKILITMLKHGGSI